MRNKQEFLITTNEAVTLVENVKIGQFIDVYKFSRSILNKLDSSKTNDPVYDNMTYINAIFNAGRIQGIREERKKRGNTQ